MRVAILLLWLLLGTAAPAVAQLGLSFNLPGLSIGVSVPIYPQLVRVPGYPVYYAPALQSNFFFYDGLYWVYQDDDWYASDWYDGPWGQVSPVAVPLYVLRIPVRYYRSPPPHFRGWRANAAPRWGEHWGNDWQRQRRGWERWDRKSAPAPAPLPNYQRPYAAERYPRPDQQRDLRQRNYRSQPREAVTREHRRRADTAPVPQRPGEPRDVRPQASPVPAPQPSQERRPWAAPGRERSHGDGQQQAPNRQEQGRPERGSGRDKGEARNKGHDKERDNDRKK